MAAIQAAERGVVVLLNCDEESAEQMFAQFQALDEPEAQAAPRAPPGWTCAPTASAPRS